MRTRLTRKSTVPTLVAVAALLAACGGGGDQPPDAASEQQTASESGVSGLYVAAARGPSGWYVNVVGASLDEVTSMQTGATDVLALIRRAIADGSGDIVGDATGFHFSSSDLESAPAAGETLVFATAAGKVAETDLIHNGAAQADGDGTSALALSSRCVPKKISLPSVNRPTCRFGEYGCVPEKPSLSHAGIDYGGRGPVIAVADGEVVKVIKDGTTASHRFGHTILVGHLTGCRSPLVLFSQYSHLRELPAGLRPGSVVKVGQIIGQAGETGFSHGVHLHFALTPVALLGNPMPVGTGKSYACDSNARAQTCFGYVPGMPTTFGWVNPNDWLKYANSSLVPR